MLFAERWRSEDDCAPSLAYALVRWKVFGLAGIEESLMVRP